MLTLSLDSEYSNLSTTGGKGHNLSILTRSRGGGNNNYSTNNILVPPGFVVTVEAYHNFLHQDDHRLLKKIEFALKNEKTDDDDDDDDADDEDDLEATSAAIRAAFRKCSLSNALQTEVADRISKLMIHSNRNNSDTSKQCYFAVRSSATCEDMPDTSFAGQHDTYLNVPSADVCERIVDCFSSLFTSRAISYRNRCGMSHIHIGGGGDSDAAGMAVVVQAMASPSQHSSGVLFTANPLTGRRNESVLEAIPGLGEALVSGLTEPDRYVVTRRTRRSNDDDDDDDDDDAREESGSTTTIRIKDRRIGAKRKVIHSVEGGGVVEETFSTNDDEDEKAPGASSSAILTDDEVETIVRLGQEIEALFEGKPQDIEWARSSEGGDGKFYIVQSRPITTLFPLPNVPADPLRVFFSFNAVQGIVAPIYPAGQDAIRKALLGGMLRWITWGKHGNEGVFLQTVAERLYIDVTNPFRNSVGRRILRTFLPFAEPGSAAALEQLVVEEPDMRIDSGMSLVLFFRMLSLALVIVPRIVVSVVFPDWNRKRVVRRVNSFVDHVEMRVEATTNLCDLVALECEVFDSLFSQIMPRLAPRFAAAMISLSLLTKLASSVPNGKDLVLTMTRGIHHNVTTEMDLKLWKVAKAIQSDTDSLEYFKSSNTDVLATDYLRGNLPAPAQNAIRHFMKEYGMRGLYEIDFGRPRWREEPAPLMNTLKSYVEMGDDRAPDKVFAGGRVEAERAVRQLGEKLGRPRLVSFLARRVHSLAGLRELPKFTMIRIMGHLRSKMLEEGAKLVEMDIIDHERDIFYLRMDEMVCLAKGELNDPKGIIGERKAVMESESERTHLPRAIASNGYAYYGGSVASNNTKEGSNVLCGEPVSPGTYEGRIRIIHDPSKAKLSQGEVLCCHGTDPSWTPLFLSAGALVMEVGGLMTHGSVVAREYGIPAVVGLNKVTERLTTGQLVRIDGSSGVVEIID